MGLTLKLSSQPQYGKLIVSNVLITILEQMSNTSV